MEATIQESLIDIDALDQELVKGAAEISQVIAKIKCFKQTDASQNSEALSFRHVARPVIVE